MFPRRLSELLTILNSFVAALSFVWIPVLARAASPVVLELDPPTTSFGVVAPGGSASSSLSIRNAGLETVDVDSIELGGADAAEFSVPLLVVAPFTLAPGKEREITLRFRPQSAGVKEAVARVHVAGRRDPVARARLVGGVPQATLGIPAIGAVSSVTPLLVGVDPGTAAATAGRVVLVDASVAPSGGVSAALFARYGRPPTPWEYDARAAAPFSSRQRLLLEPESRELFLLVTSSAASEAGVTATVDARLARIALASVGPRVTSTAAGSALLTIAGHGFGPDAQFRLLGPGGSSILGAIRRIHGASLIEVEFPTASATLGTYDLEVMIVLAGNTHLDRLIGAVEISASPEAPRFVARIRTARSYRRGTPGVARLLYRNAGGIAMPAPWLRVSYVRLPATASDTGTRLSLSPEGPFEEDAVQIIASSPYHPDGWLAPSDRFHEITIYFVGEGDIGPGDFRLAVVDASSLGETVPWESLALPPGVPERRRAQLASRWPILLGQTWEDVRAAFVDEQARLARRGTFEPSVARLLAFVTRGVYGRPRAAISGRIVDSLGRPIEGIEITALEEDEPVATAFSSKGGAFVLEGLLSGVEHRVLVDRYDIGDPVLETPAGGDLIGVKLVGVRDEIERRDFGCARCDDSDLPLGAIGPPSADFELETRDRVIVVAAIDPNSKGGPPGDGPGELYHTSGADLGYVVSFANEAPEGVDPSFIVPALRVEVFDELEEDFDFDSVELGFVQLNDDFPVDLEEPGDCFIVPGVPCASEAPGLRTMATTAVTSYREDDGTLREVSVRITASIDSSSRRLAWQIESIPGDDGTSPFGFLPLHDATSGILAGSGVVSFTADAKDDGDDECEEIENSAKIRFDVFHDDDEDELNTRITAVDTRFIDCPDPEAPENPAPADGALIPEGAPPAALGWTGDGRDDTRFAVVLRRGESVILSLDDLAAASAPIPIVAPGEYSWRVTASNPRSDVEGPEWRFTLAGETTIGFVRGDVNASGAIDLSDGIYSLSWLFLGGPAPPCRDAADANADRSLDIADPIFVLGWLFIGGPSPQEPTPSATNYPSTDCGTVVEPSLGCDSFAPCL
jgi:hypothetical protein